MSCSSCYQQTAGDLTGDTGVPVGVATAQEKCPECGWVMLNGVCWQLKCSQYKVAGNQSEKPILVDGPPQPAPQPAQAQGVEEPVPQKDDGASATEKLKEEGISLGDAQMLLAQDNPQVWQYLMRCDTCGTFISPRTGQCSNDRCSLYGKQVCKPTGWQWPPRKPRPVSLEREEQPAESSPEGWTFRSLKAAQKPKEAGLSEQRKSAGEVLSWPIRKSAKLLLGGLLTGLLSLLNGLFSFLPWRR